MLDLFLSIVTGGATGLLGTVISGVTQFVQAQQKHAQEMELRRLDLEMMDREAASAERITAIEAETAESAAQWAAFEASYKEAGHRWSAGDSKWLVVVDIVRGLTRPGLTWAFVALTGTIYFTIAVPEDQSRIVNTILYLATTCVLWWFGARQVGKAPGAGAGMAR